MKPKDPSPAEVRKLIESLHPRNCGKGLLRLGGKGDGGYLIPNDLDDIKYCFSAGVGDSIDFEIALAKCSVASFLIDGSIAELPSKASYFGGWGMKFDRMFLGAINDRTTWTMERWISKYPSHNFYGNAILKMDIEGSEYEALLSTPAWILEHFRIIVVEFHSLDRMFDAFGFPLIRACFQKLNEAFQVVHLHPNNCCPLHVRDEIEIPELMEFTFYNRFRNAGSFAPFTQTYPLPLDQDNIPDKDTLALPRCWYHQSIN